MKSSPERVGDLCDAGIIREFAQGLVHGTAPQLGLREILDILCDERGVNPDTYICTYIQSR